MTSLRLDVNFILDHRVRTTDPWGEHTIQKPVVEELEMADMIDEHMVILSPEKPHGTGYGQGTVKTTVRFQTRWSYYQAAMETPKINGEGETRKGGVLKGKQEKLPASPEVNELGCAR